MSTKQSEVHDLGQVPVTRHVLMLRIEEDLEWRGEQLRYLTVDSGNYPLLEGFFDLETLGRIYHVLRPFEKLVD